MANLMVGKELDTTLDKTEHDFGEVVLDVSDLTVYNEHKVKVVDNVSLRVRQGEILAIAGVSGNGQVDIADAIAGLQHISAGSISLKGEEISRLSIKERIARGISYIPEDRQKDGLVMDLTLRDNLAIKTFDREPFAKKGVLQPEAFEQQATDLIERYDIRSGQGSQTMTRSMSGGNQQKAIIAREVELDSDLLIFVQPTRGLDVGAIANIHQQILEQRDKGKAVLLVSLELDEVLALADTICVAFRGQILKTDSAKNLSKEEVGQYMMGVTQ
jgi:simple sugar transport system ATP-binding protein